jgi:hypothetical protein
MNHQPPPELTAEQIRSVLEYRGIAVADDDLLALPGLATALRRQANGLRDVLVYVGDHRPAEGGLA